MQRVICGGRLRDPRLRNVIVAVVWENGNQTAVELTEFVKGCVIVQVGVAEKVKVEVGQSVVMEKNGFAAPWKRQQPAKLPTQKRSI